VASNRTTMLARHFVLLKPNEVYFNNRTINIVPWLRLITRFRFRSVLIKADEIHTVSSLGFGYPAEVDSTEEALRMTD